MKIVGVYGGWNIGGCQRVVGVGARMKTEGVSGGTEKAVKTWDINLITLNNFHKMTMSVYKKLFCMTNGDCCISGLQLFVTDVPSIIYGVEQLCETYPFCGWWKSNKHSRRCRKQPWCIYIKCPFKPYHNIVYTLSVTPGCAAKGCLTIF